MEFSSVALLTLTDVVDYLIIGFVVLAFGTLAVGFLVEGLVSLRLRVQMLMSDPLPIALVASTPGPVEITGTVRTADEVVRAPFSDIECVACEYEITKWSGGGSESSGHETTIYEGRVQTRFYVEDETASVLVDPAGATLNFEGHETVIHPAPFGFLTKGVPASLKRFLDEHPKYDVDASLFNSSTQTFIERRLEPGEQVHIYGVARYDSRVSRRAGTINAIIEASPMPSGSLFARLRARIATPRFVISDTNERATVRSLVIDTMIYLGILAAGIWFIIFEL